MNRLGLVHQTCVQWGHVAHRPFDTRAPAAAMMLITTPHLFVARAVVCEPGRAIPLGALGVVVAAIGLAHTNIN